MLKSNSMLRIGRRIFCMANSQASILCPISTSLVNGHTNFSTTLNLNRSKFRHSRFHIPVLWELHRRREEVGPEEAKHRSEYPNWNYDAELYGFCKRLNEDWTRETLVEAFTERSYAEAEEERRQSLRAKRKENVDDSGETSTSLTPLINNESLAQQGENLIRQFVSAFLQHSLPKYPKEGVISVSDFLVSDDLLGYVAKNLGIADLILCTELPPKIKTFANVLKALVGGLARDQGSEKACYFIHDFIVTQLVGRDINQFWQINNPIGLLAKTMQSEMGLKGEPEPRLIWSTGSETPLGAFKVAIYDSDSKKMLGSGGGETVEIAEQMAAFDSLQRHWGTTESMAPLLFGRDAVKLSIVEKLKISEVKQ